MVARQNGVFGGAFIGRRQHDQCPISATINVGRFLDADDRARDDLFTMEPERAATGTNERMKTKTITGVAPTGLSRALVTHNHGVVEGRSNVGDGAGTS